MIIVGVTCSGDGAVTGDTGATINSGDGAVTGGTGATINSGGGTVVPGGIIDVTNFNPFVGVTLVRLGLIGLIGW